MSTINIGGLVAGLGVGINQGQRFRSNNQNMQRQGVIAQREDAAYARQQDELGKRDEFRARVKSTLSGLDGTDNFATANVLNDLAVEGAMVDPEGAKSLLPLAQLNMQKHMQQVSQKGVAALQSGNAQEMAALGAQIPGFGQVDKNEDGSYMAAFDPATRTFNFSVQGKPVAVSSDQATSMIQSFADPNAALSALQNMTKANVKEVNGGLYDVRTGKWILEPKGEKPTIVNNGGENILVDSSGKELARYKKSAEPVRTSVVRHEGNGGGRGSGTANTVQSTKQNPDGSWTMIMKNGSTKRAVDEHGQPITGVTPEQIKRLQIAGKVYIDSQGLGAENPMDDAAAAGNIPLPQTDAARNRPAAAGGISPRQPGGNDPLGLRGGK